MISSKLKILEILKWDFPIFSKFSKFSFFRFLRFFKIYLIFFKKNQQKNQTFSKKSQNLSFFVKNFQRVLRLKHVENV